MSIPDVTKEFKNTSSQTLSESDGTNFGIITDGGLTVYTRKERGGGEGTQKYGKMLWVNYGRSSCRGEYASVYYSAVV